MPDHMFLVFIAQMQSSDDADTVALAARRSDREGAFLGLSSGSICCIGVARSVAIDVEPIEDQQSIERFAGPFREALVLG